MIAQYEIAIGSDGNKYKFMEYNWNNWREIKAFIKEYWSDDWCYKTHWPELDTGIWFCVWDYSWCKFISMVSWDIVLLNMRGDTIVYTHKNIFYKMFEVECESKYTEYTFFNI